nr:uncharacterized protein LOC106028903 [Cavia porcellus]
MISDGMEEREMPTLQYWPFSSSDLYNWKNTNPSFSEDPTNLTGLVDSLMFSHQPTGDDCQQFLGIVFTTEERDRILLEARKNIPGDDRRPTQRPDQIDDVFPLKRPDWDPNTPDAPLLPSKTSPLQTIALRYYPLFCLTGSSLSSEYKRSFGGNCPRPTPPATRQPLTHVKWVTSCWSAATKLKPCSLAGKDLIKCC